MPKTATFGVEDPLTAFSDAVKRIMTGLGYFEVVTLSLSNPRDQFQAMNLEDKGAVKVKNPVSEEHILVRTSLLPSLMNLLRRNKHRELPQRVFETGDVVIGLKNHKKVCAASIHAKAGFTEMKSVVQSVLKGLGLDCEVSSIENPSFVRGRCAAVKAGNEDVGLFGEVSPSTITAFDLKYPVVAFELDLERLHALRATGHKASSC